MKRLNNSKILSEIVKLRAKREVSHEEFMRLVKLEDQLKEQRVKEEEQMAQKDTNKEESRNRPQSSEAAPKKDSVIAKNLYRAMKKQLCGGAIVNASKRILGSGWKKLPSVNKFIVRVRPYNSIMQKVGINLRVPPQLEVVPRRENQRMNRYLQRMVIKIRKLRDQGEYKKVWTKIYLLLRYSITFRMSAYHHILPKWYYTMTVGQISAINRKVSKILRDADTNFEYHRVYIPKAKPDGSKTYRPLGVPNIEWRIVLHMWNNMIQIMLEKKLLPTQHGFIPGRGTGTAWRALLKLVNKHKYIYEADLKQFFPSVNTEAITKSLITKVGMPKKLAEMFEQINQRSPELPQEELLDESVFQNRGRYARGLRPIERGEEMVSERLKSEYRERWGKPGLPDRPSPRTDIFWQDMLNGEPKAYKEIFNIERENSRPARTKPGGFINQIRGKIGRSMEEWLFGDINKPLEDRTQSNQQTPSQRIGKAIRDNLNLTKSINQAAKDGSYLIKGVAQGAPTSPLLSITILEKFLNKQEAREKVFNRETELWDLSGKVESVKSISYADDPVFFANNYFELKEDKQLGVIVSKAKSGWVKRGRWEKDLKYLGLKLVNSMPVLYAGPEGTKYTIKDQELVACTRNGSRMWIPEGLKSLICIENNKALRVWEHPNQSESWNGGNFLEKVSEKKIFGFIQSCLYNASWDNSAASENQKKGLANQLKVLNKKSLLGKIPGPTDSSWSMTKLYGILSPTMKVNRKRHLKWIRKELMSKIRPEVDWEKYKNPKGAYITREIQPKVFPSEEFKEGYVNNTPTLQQEAV